MNDQNSVPVFTPNDVIFVPREVIELEEQLKEIVPCDWPEGCSNEAAWAGKPDCCGNLITPCEEHYSIAKKDFEAYFAEGPSFHTRCGGMTNRMDWYPI